MTQQWISHWTDQFEKKINIFETHEDLFEIVSSEQKYNNLLIRPYKHREEFYEQKKYIKKSFKRIQWINL